VLVFLADGLLTPGGGTKTIWFNLGVHGDTLSHPLRWWQLLTSGFVHDPSDLKHIIFNMAVLWFLGQAVERRYGRGEFLRLYLAAIVIGSIVWTLTNWGHPMRTAIGASGAVTTVVILFALNFPKRTLLLFFVLPVPAWAVGILVVVTDLYGAAGRGGEENIAYGIHLAGAAFALVYFKLGLNLTRLTSGWPSLGRLRPRPKLRIHDPSTEDTDLSAQVDRILEKIHREGETSLSRKERRILESASRKYQERRDQP